VLCDDLEEWDGGEVWRVGDSRGRGYIYIYTHYYAAETNTTLKSNY